MTAEKNKKVMPLITTYTSDDSLDGEEDASSSRRESSGSSRGEDEDEDNLPLVRSSLHTTISLPMCGQAMHFANLF